MTAADPAGEAGGGHGGGDEEAPGSSALGPVPAPLVVEGAAGCGGAEQAQAQEQEQEDAEAEAAAAVVFAYQRGDGRRHDLDPIPPAERTWTTWSFLSLYVRALCVGRRGCID